MQAGHKGLHNVVHAVVEKTSDVDLTGRSVQDLESLFVGWRIKTIIAQTRLAQPAGMKLGSRGRHVTCRPSFPHVSVVGLLVSRIASMFTQNMTSSMFDADSSWSDTLESCLLGMTIVHTVLYSHRFIHHLPGHTMCVHTSRAKFAYKHGNVSILLLCFERRRVCGLRCHFCIQSFVECKTHHQTIRYRNRIPRIGQVIKTHV